MSSQAEKKQSSQAGSPQQEFYPEIILRGIAFGFRLSFSAGRFATERTETQKFFITTLTHAIAVIPARPGIHFIHDSSVRYKDARLRMIASPEDIRNIPGYSKFQQQDVYGYLNFSP